MNVRIGHLFGLVVLLFGLLVGFTSYWSVFDAHGLETNPANKRLLLEEQRIRRGLIFARDGTELARNKATGRGSSRFYQRTYPILDFYRQRGISVEIDGQGSIREVRERVKRALQGQTGEAA